MIEVSLYLVNNDDIETPVGRLVARSRYDKESLGVGIMKFVKGFLKNHTDEFMGALKNPALIDLINNDDIMTVADLNSINYCLLKAGFMVQIVNVTEDEEDPESIPSGRIEWSIIDKTFLQNDYPTATRIIAGENEDVSDILKKIVDQTGLFNREKFSGIKNPFTVPLANLLKIKELTGSINGNLVTKIMSIFEQMGTKIFCATSSI